MNFEDGLLVGESIEDIANFANKLGGIDKIAFRDPVLDDKKKVLIQANRPLSQSILNQLMAREKSLQITYVLANTQELRNHVATVLGNEIQKKLAFEASFTSSLIKNKNFDIFMVMRSALNHDSFFTIICRCLYEDFPIFSHLLDVALLATGIYAEARLGQAHLSELVSVFIAGMLHDYEIMNSSMWHEKDSFPAEDEHDIRSFGKLSAKALPEGVAEMVRYTNRLEARFVEAKNAKITDRWYKTTTELGSAVLNIVEYFTTALREFNTKEIEQKDKSTELQEVLFLVSYQASMGVFAKPLVSIFERHYEKHAKIFAYGEEIAKIEQSCLYKVLALAYPKPRAVQVLCRDETVACKFRIFSSPINIVQNLNKTVVRTGKVLQPGWYYKCQLSDKLPYPPFEL